MLESSHLRWVAKGVSAAHSSSPSGQDKKKDREEEELMCISQQEL